MVLLAEALFDRHLRAIGVIAVRWSALDRMLFDILRDRLRLPVDAEKLRTRSSGRARLALFQSCVLLPRIVGTAVSNVLVKRAIAQRNTDDAADAGIEARPVGRTVEKVDVESHNRGGPAIETEHLICQIDQLPPFNIGELLATSWPWSLREILWTETLIELGLERSDA